MAILSRRAVFFVGLVASIVLQCGCNRWTELGPPGSGRISGIVLSDANHLWVTSPGGGVWKTTDGGAHWVWAGNFGLDDFTALDIAFDRVPSVGRRHRMFLRTWNGFWVSTDEGATWTRTLFSVGNGDTSFFQPFLVCSIGRPGPGGRIPIVLGSVVLTALPCNGLQYSIDRGNNFTQLWPFPGNQNN